ncbi:LANO_0A04852g1_1 [Lachancea nothofagi CBS 11611]|uniref:Delta(14)-sterol reductase n=1 Tax=Lachancea nothofagi CBS 11611 TaxID=1266666 RepID=A0A1G4IR45_9SACH|nr:LANO_0A04852g1_1 [Lachancea nothofagi CBS 11611]
MAKSTGPLNPKTTSYEFSGIPGVLGVTFGLPLVCVVLNQMIRRDYFIVGAFSNFDVAELWNHIKPLKWYLTNRELWTYYLAWFGGLALFDVVLPGRTMEGVELRDGTKLPYKINGLALTSTLLATLCIRWQLTNGEMPELQYLYNNQTDLCIIVIIFSFIMSLFLYGASFIPLANKNGHGTRERVLSVSGNSKNIVYDWFIGRELNPRLGPLDLKMFCELRPGLLLWFLINVACLHHYYLQTGKVNNAILFVTLAEGFYIFDGVLNEEGVLTMMDITTDGFGYMLAFGDLALVPFTYTLQARYLTVSPINLSRPYLAFLVATMSLGYYIFHSANKQKSDFRHGKLPHLKSIDTKRGTKLLCDGWWGMSQHMNYFGDWLISLSWCLATGFQTPLTYYYSLYFATLLIHRQKRDEHLCKIKYGDDWQRYESKVPYKIVPYVY